MAPPSCPRRPPYRPGRRPALAGTETCRAGGSPCRPAASAVSTASRSWPGRSRDDAQKVRAEGDRCAQHLWQVTSRRRLPTTPRCRTPRPRSMGRTAFERSKPKRDARRVRMPRSGLAAVEGSVASRAMSAHRASPAQPWPGWSTSRVAQAAYGKHLVRIGELIPALLTCTSWIAAIWRPPATRLFSAAGLQALSRQGDPVGLGGVSRPQGPRLGHGLG